MIRREVGSEFFLIPQHDHAMLAGKLAERFGNEKFARPMPWESAILAVRLHDCGWPMHDERPTLNPKRLPLDVFETPRPIALKVWAAAAQQVAALDPYAGLLVSLHSLSLSILASTFTTGQHEKFDTAQLSERFEINKFQHREVERQESLRKQLGLRIDLPLTHGLAELNATDEDDQLIFNFRMLQAMDLISLCLCCTVPPANKSQDVFPTPGDKPLQLTMHRDPNGALIVDPWPFNVDEIILSVPAWRMPRREFRDQSDFKESFSIARLSELPVVVCPA
jgi:hypothetical protein